MMNLTSCSTRPPGAMFQDYVFKTGNLGKKHRPAQIFRHFLPLNCTHL
jgi:hypothetical protein